MRILGLSQPGSGCGFHRIVLPLGYMDGVTGYVTNQPDAEKLAEGWDILFYNRLSVFDEGWDEVRKQMSSKIVIDMDDDWTLPPNHLNFFAYEELKPRIENNIREADMVLCTNENLASRIYPLNKNCHIVPNALPYGSHQFQPDKREDERIRIFWAGGVTHECDIKILANPVKRLNVFSDKIKMVLAGYNDTDPNTKRIWDNMFNDFTNSRKLPFTKLHSLEVHNYMQLYEWADIMLVPLENSWWHSCKSNLKLLEAATKSIPVICSHVAPYSLDADAPVLWVKSQKDWFIHIKDLILNPNKREDYGEALKEWANRKYNLFEVNKRRKELFDNLVKA
jgi:hypothetical protein